MTSDASAAGSTTTDSPLARSASRTSTSMGNSPQPEAGARSDDDLPRLAHRERGRHDLRRLRIHPTSPHLATSQVTRSQAPTHPLIHPQKEDTVSARCTECGCLLEQ